MQFSIHFCLLLALRGMRLIPQTTIKLQNVSVEMSGSTYTITMMAHDCRTGIPLFQAAYGTLSGGVYTDSSWGSASVGTFILIVDLIKYPTIFNMHTRSPLLVHKVPPLRLEGHSA